MAFYTSRVDDAGREIERRKSNCSSVNNSVPVTPCAIPRYYVGSLNKKKKTKSVTKIINAAAFIEKLEYDEDDEYEYENDIIKNKEENIVKNLVKDNLDNAVSDLENIENNASNTQCETDSGNYMDIQTDSEVHVVADVNAKYNISDTDSSAVGSNAGTEDGDVIMNPQSDDSSYVEACITDDYTNFDSDAFKSDDTLSKGSEFYKPKQSDIENSSFGTINSGNVPSIVLKSGKSDSTNATRDYVHCYNKWAYPLRPDDAYDTWLSAKNRTLATESDRRKKIAEEKLREKEARKQLAIEKYNAWLREKSLQQARSRENLKNSATQLNTVNTQKVQKPQISKEEAKAKHERWERQKRIEDQLRREKELLAEKRRRDLEQKRRREADEAFERWVATANQKPKPVPANRGLFSLRGTVSDIYVNPKEWQGAVDEDDENNSI